MVSGDYFRGATEVNPDLDRWSAVLENFARIRQGFKKEEISKAQGRYLSELKETAGLEEIEKESEERERTEEILINLAKECWKDTYLREIGLKLASHPDINKLDDPRHVINQVLDLAEDYYQRLWAISGKDEKMVLFRLCQEGLVSWRSRELVRRLIHRGLIIAAPDFRPLNESFRRFVLHAELPEVLETWEREAGASLWSRFRLPLAVAIGALLIFFLSTQRELFQQTLTITAALAAAAPALIKIVAVMLQTRARTGSED